MCEGKTIKQIADEIGVTKQAIQKRIVREPLCTCIQPYIDKIGGTKYIAYTGEMIIKQAFLDVDCIHVSGEKPSNVHTSSIPADDDLNALYSILKKELDMKNEQIRELNARLAESNAALVAAQQTAQTAQALHAGTIKKHLQSADQEIPSQNLGLIARIFNKHF